MQVCKKTLGPKKKVLQDQLFRALKIISGNFADFYDLEGSDTPRQRNRKKAVKKAIEPFQKIKGVTIKSNEVASAIDEIPVLAIVALFCKSKSYFYDLTELKYKESNRLEVIYKNLKLCGADIVKQKDNLIINGLIENFYSSQTPIIKDFKSDHRIAMQRLISY